MFESPLPQPDEPPACAACSHLIGRRDNPDYFMGWLCNHPENIFSRTRNLVTGCIDTKYVKMNCVEAREDAAACGPAGKGFELYVRPEHPGRSPSARGKAREVDDLLSELENI